MSDLTQRLAKLSPAKRKLLEQRMGKRPAAAEPIAVVGMACRFPGAANLADYWRLIAEGIDATGEIPASRWNVDELYDPTGEQSGKTSTRWGGFVADIDQFDPQFFGITPREAARMDPQQRLLLEVAWEALETAGMAGNAGGTKTGVFVGIGGTDYSKIPAQYEDYFHHIDAHVGTGNALSIAANRLSYIFDLHGPSLAVDTACSSSTMGVHLAVQALRNGECTAALAGGVNCILTPETTIAFSKARMLSPDGKCRPFDAEANGYVRGEGCGMLVLKRLKDAQRDGDPVLAVLRASATNQDGRTSGITAPNGRSQQAVIRAALAQAGLAPEDIHYIEAHGTGTPLGDPIEMEALTRIFPRRSEADRPVYVTSVKANVGHMETVSGVAGMIKVILLMQHAQIAPQLHLQELNPRMQLDGSRIVIPREPVAWPAVGPRVAGVSSFGFGGANTHVVLEGPPTESDAPSPAPTQRPRHVLALSAKSDAALAELAGRMSAHLAASPDVSVADVCFSANTGRAHFNHRLALTATDAGELQEQLAACAAGKPPRQVRQGQLKQAQRPQIAMLFTGQGSQYVGMGRALYETQPTFRAAIDECDAILTPRLGRSLVSVLYADSEDDSPINETAFTQPALFALEYATAMLWQSWGIQPDIVLGHSVGEYVAACIAGVFSLEDGLHLIAARGRLMQQLPSGGKMAVLFAPQDQVAAALGPYAEHVAIAATNGPENTVISGDAAAVDAIIAALAEQDVSAQPLAVSHAFHSPAMQPMLDEFAAIASEVTFHRPNIALVANRTGRVMDTAPDAAYWCDHIRYTVRFAESMQTVAELAPGILLEVGPTPSLIGMGRRCQGDLDATWLPSLRKGADDWSVLLDAVAELYTHGAPLDWIAFDQDSPRRRLALPTYPFQRARHWFEPQGDTRRALTGTRGRSLHPLLGARVPSVWANSLYEVSLSSRAPKFLADHVVQGSVVTPAAAFLETAQAAAAQVFGDGPHLVENLLVQQAMFLPEGASRTVQISVAPESGGSCAVEIYGRPSDNDHANWTLHAAAQVRCGPAEPAGRLPELEDFARRVIDVRAQDEIYTLFATRGLQYGPAFQVLTEMRRTEYDALAQFRLPTEITDQLKSYTLHPALLDGCFQLMAGIVPLEADGQYSPYTYMPVGVGRYEIYAPIPADCQAYAVRTSADDNPSPDEVAGDIVLLAGDEIVCRLKDVHVRRVGRSAAKAGSADPRDWLYQLQWQPAPHNPASTNGHGPDPTTQVSTDTGVWLLLADQRGVGDRLAERLATAGNRCVLVDYLPTTRATECERETIDPVAEQDYRRLLEEIVGNEIPLLGVVHLWNLDLDQADAAATPEAARLGVASVLALLKQLARSSVRGNPRLHVVTAGGQTLDGEDTAAAPLQGPAWGLGRVAAMEYADLPTRLIDLDPNTDSAEQAACLEPEITTASDENQIAYRAEQRLAARLAPAADLLEQSSSGGTRLAIPRNSSYQLALASTGSFDGLEYQPFECPLPQAGQVAIRVEAAGLNFSDVLKAMGLYPGLGPGRVPLGIETSGVVTAVGEGVTRFQPGDAVFGVAPHSFASHAVTAEYALAHKPAAIDDVSACTIPITFLTAYYALVQLADLQPGERVLIHAGAGGVGLAAIQIAQHVGAEIFATAGSDTKRDHLRSLGVEHVLNSRTTEFAEEIRRITDRQGVDVILNSLPGEAIPASLSILRAYGRFLEIGKTDIYQNRMIGLLPFQDNLSYSAIDLDRMLRQRPAAIERLFAAVMERFAAGDYRPLEHTCFTAPQTADAFRYMAQRKNIGKVVVSMAAETEPTDAPPEQGPIRNDGTYLVTGGLGALGLQLADWLVDQGAGAVALLSRRTPGEAAQAEIARLAEKGTTVVALSGDVTQLDSLRAALAELPADAPPLRGVIHAAGVLDDGMLLDMDQDQLTRAMAPKLIGGWNLHEATRDAPLDHFVLFSSVACLLGSPGQANYAAGNASLDALAAYRRAQGLPALSINWGPWAGSGMAAQDGRDADLESRGMRLLPAAGALDVLTGLLSGSASQVMVADADWGDLARVLGERRPPLLVDVLPEGDMATDSPAAEVDEAFRAAVLAADDESRRPMMVEYFARELARIMGIEVDELDTQQPLTSMGIDSLLAMELKNNLEARLLITLPMARFLDNPSVSSLADDATASLVETAGDVAPAEVAAGDAPESASWSPLMPLTPDNSSRPLFVVHPLGGDVRCYRDMATAMAPERPVVALTSRGVDGRQPPHTDLNDLAADYVASIRRRQPTGPYYLAGWSAGGIFSLQIAQSLRAAGEDVALLALVDTPRPSIYDQVDLDDDARFLADLLLFTSRFSDTTLDITREELHRGSPEERFAAAVGLAREHGILSADVSVAHVRHLVEVGKAHVRMIRSFDPADFGQTVHLIRPDETHVLEELSGQQHTPDLGWHDVFGDHLIVHHTPGDHFSMVRDDEAALLARRISECIAAVRTPK